mmetsp:Transcript_83357/g.258875  ORF Transcript_83357/g.258875 Transcript_83357/m.258875 type:complete len:887 (-) Transcript_83357:18-2678(-)
MSTDPVMLGVLSRVCQQELQMFERVTVVHEGEEGGSCFLCVGNHSIFFVNREMSSLVEGDELSYLAIERAVSDEQSSRFFLLELIRDSDKTWGNDGSDRILVESNDREGLLNRIGLCWQAEYMFRNFQVKKFPQAKAQILNLLPGLASKAPQYQVDLIQVKPFRKYASQNGKDDFKFRGYSFFLREEFKSVGGLRNGIFVHESGWQEVYNAQKVTVPAGVEVTVHVSDAISVMELERSSTGADDLRTTAAEYKQAVTQHLQQFYVTANGPYMKRMNRTNDIASWDGWEFFVRSHEHVYACVLFRREYIPPLCDMAQDLAVLLRCPAVNLSHDTCEVILDECRFAADSLASTSQVKPYREIIQARLDALQFNEEGYRWAEGKLGLYPCHKRPAALKFVKAIIHILANEGFIEESLIDSPIFNDIPKLNDPLLVPQEMLSDTDGLLGDSTEPGETPTERLNAWHWRVSRYLTYCVDGGILDDRFTMAHMLQAVGRGSPETDKTLKAVVEFLLHVRPRGNWERSFSQVSVPISQLLQAPEELDRYSFNEKVMRLLLTENYLANEWKKKSAGRERGATYEKLQATLLRSENAGLGLRTLICRQILETTGAGGEAEPGASDDRSVHVLVPALVSVMQSGNLSLASCATAALVNLSSNKPATKTLLVTEGVLKLAVRQLRTKDEDLTLYSLFLLVNLTKAPDHRSIVVTYGGVPVLVDILTSSYQNLRKQRIIAEVASVIGQLCNDAETRSHISDEYPVVLCLLWIFDSSQPNTKLKSKVLFALRQLCAIGANKIKVGPHVILRVLDEIAQAVPGKYDECLSNSILLLICLSSVHSNARMIGKNDRLDDALEACGLQHKGEESKKHRFGPLIWERVQKLKERVREAKYSEAH